ncbi:hypothetical protein Clacol_003847 [Clathrus columnatus]|uniref:Alcohol acetyltransferase n=1 Tax=Clathrus columnatus TaxID=1419009 RepID=A0AAV5AA72_9AGAM|nr:hypothetical protein Clacol_003847 [Clathrus columnatus]
MPPNGDLSDLKSSQDRIFERQLGDSFKAPQSVINPRRVALAWAIFRIRHPLLASRVLATPGNYEKVFFQYYPPSSPSEAEADAYSSLEIRQEKAEVLIDYFLNGPRTLSNNRLSYLILSLNGSPTSENEPLQDFDLLICATHFLGDGMALHMLANDFFTLLALSEKPISDSELYRLLIKEWETWGESSADVSIVERDVLPPTLESRLPKPNSGFQRIAQKLEFYASQDRVLGSQVFPRQGTTNPKPKRHTIVLTTSFDRCETIKILAHCKKENVTIGHLLFAICNAAWIKIGKPDERLPMMMYSALNLRPYIPPSTSDDCSSKIRSLSDSYWFLAVGYFNVVLPSFLARSVFHRARLVKRQCMAASKSQLLLSRTRCMANERSVKAQKYAMIDDDELDVKMNQVDIRLTKSTSESAALLGLSLLGNLDGIYQHDDYHPSVILNTLTTGSRQRSGGLLVFGYTFAGKLWLSIGYDKESYNHQVEVWWDEVVKEMMRMIV